MYWGGHTQTPVMGSAYALPMHGGGNWVVQGPVVTPRTSWVHPGLHTHTPEASENTHTPWAQAASVVHPWTESSPSFGSTPTTTNVARDVMNFMDMVTTQGALQGLYTTVYTVNE